MNNRETRRERRWMKSRRREAKLEKEDYDLNLKWRTGTFVFPLTSNTMQETRSGPSQSSTIGRCCFTDTVYKTYPCQSREQSGENVWRRKLCKLENFWVKSVQPTKVTKLLWKKGEKRLESSGEILWMLKSFVPRLNFNHWRERTNFMEKEWIKNRKKDEMLSSFGQVTQQHHIANRAPIYFPSICWSFNHSSEK